MIRHNRILRVFLLFLLCVLPCRASDSKTTAEQLAPLLDESTCMILLIDLEKLDLDKIYGKLIEGLDESVALFGFDERSTKRIVREAEKTILRAKGKFVRHLGRIRKSMGVKEIVLGVQIDSHESEDESDQTEEKSSDAEAYRIGLFMAVHVGERSDRQREQWNDLWGFVDDIPFLHRIEHGGFDIMIFQQTQILGKEQWDSDDFAEEESAQAAFSKPRPDAAVLLEESLEVQKDAPLKMVFFYNDAIASYSVSSFTQLDKTDVITLSQEILDRYRASIVKIAEQTRWAVMKIDLETMSMESVIQPKEEKKIDELLEATLESYDPTGDVLAQMFTRHKDFEPYRPFFAECFKGFYRTFHYEKKEDRLVYRLEFGKYGSAIFGFYTVIFNVITPNPEEEEEEEDE